MLQTEVEGNVGGQREVKRVKEITNSTVQKYTECSRDRPLLQVTLRGKKRNDLQKPEVNKILG